MRGRSVRPPLKMKFFCVSRCFSRPLASSAVLQKLPKNGKVYYPAGLSSSDPPALTLLVGWMASREKVIGKYTSVYTQLGIPCLALAPNEQNVLFTSSGNSLCEAALDTLVEIKGAQTDTRSPLPLIIHMFSGAGYAIFPKLLETWSQPNSILKHHVVPKCIIFDSGPTQFAIKPGVEAANLMYKQGGFNLFTYTLVVMMGISTSILFGSQKQQLLQSALESELLNLPQLYLHSRQDTVASFEWLRGIMEGQREKGRSVYNHAWEQTEHLKLYLDHKEEYTQHIHSFLRLCKLIN